MRTILILAIVAALLAPLTVAADAPTSVSAATTIGPAPTGASDAVSYTHYDCVGPGIPGTYPAHATHTTRINGFVIDGARPVTFSASAIAIFGNGPCPTTLPGPVLPEDFTGRWTLQAVCRGTLNDGATFLTWTIHFVAGFPTSQGASGVACVGYLNTLFSLDVTVSVGSTALLGIPLGPVGGIRHGITQS